MAKKKNPSESAAQQYLQQYANQQLPGLNTTPYYSLGGWDFLPKNVSFAEKSAAKTAEDLMAYDAKHHTNLLILAAEAATGQQPANEIEAEAWVTGALDKAGAGNSLISIYGPGTGIVYDPVKKAKAKAPVTTTPPNNGGNGGGTPAAGVSSESAQAQMSAYDTMYNDLTNWGLQDLASQMYDVITKNGDMTNVNGAMAWLRQQPEYKAKFPGNAILMANGQKPMDENTYMQLENNYLGVAHTYGLPVGFLSTQEMGQLIGNNVSASEFQSRVQYGYDMAKNADPATKEYLQRWYGVGHGDLAAYYLDPQRGMDAIYKQNVSAGAAGKAVDVGFGNLSKAQAQEIAALYPTPTGGAADTTIGQIGSALGKEAAYVPLEATQIGQRGQAKVTQQQLLGQAFAGMKQETGTTAAGDAAAVRLATQARTAGLQGGGGYASSAKGAVGLGRASTAGVQGT